uniref:Secreted protein n=1 Tax=Steinernema glaseri TaxID=37863 RepID=A0A1I7YIM3_9BILA
MRALCPKEIILASAICPVKWQYTSIVFCTPLQHHVFYERENVTERVICAAKRCEFAFKRVTSFSPFVSLDQLYLGYGCFI